MTEASLICGPIARLRELDRGLSIFGADAHQWQLRPPLPPDHIDHLEQLLGAPLPTAYRRFLTEVGSAGAGPYHGILPPRITAPIGTFEGLEAARQQARENGVDIDEDGYHEIFDQDLLTRLLQGTVRIADDGCGHHLRLVLRGNEAGSVFTVGNEGGIYGPPVPFIDWVLRWLSRYLSPLEAVAERIAQADPDESWITHDNARLVGSFCGHPMGINDGPTRARLHYRELLEGRPGIPLMHRWTGLSAQLLAWERATYLDNLRAGVHTSVRGSNRGAIGLDLPHRASLTAIASRTALLLIAQTGGYGSDRFTSKREVPDGSALDAALREGLEVARGSELPPGWTAAD